MNKKVNIHLRNQMCLILQQDSKQHVSNFMDVDRNSKVSVKKRGTCRENK